MPTVRHSWHLSLGWLSPQKSVMSSVPEFLWFIIDLGKYFLLIAWWDLLGPLLSLPAQHGAGGHSLKWILKPAKVLSVDKFSSEGCIAIYAASNEHARTPEQETGLSNAIFELSKAAYATQGPGEMESSASRIAGSTVLRTLGWDVGQ